MSAVEKETKILELHEDGKVTRPNLNMTEKEEDNEIDLLDLAFLMLEKLPYIIMCALAGAVIVNLYSYLCIAPTYQSTAKLYIVSASDDSIVNLTDLNIGSSLTKDYEELIFSYPVLDQVIDRLELKMNYNQLAGMIALKNPSNTRLLNITVTSTNPQLSSDIANAVATVAVEYLPDTMSTKAPNIAQVARPANRKAGPSYMKYTLIGAILGMGIFCGIVVIGYLLDDTIHTAEDMEKYFGIVPLTTIPENDQFRQSDSGEKEREHKKGRRRAKRKHE